MRYKTLMATGAASLALAAPAWAQTSTETGIVPPQAQEGEASAGDIVVTAQRRAQRLQDVPVAVSVISGDTIARQGIRDLTELSTRMPGLKLGSSTQSDYISIRGIASGNAAGFEQAVGTFVDGVYRGRSRSARAALFDVERVEVLKGPQTTFFGNNTIAGALNITTRKPGRDLEYNANLLYSPSDGEYNIEGGISMPLTDTLSARLAVKFNGMDGYIRNTFLNEDGPHLRDWVGRVSLRWEPSEDLTSSFRFDRIRNRDRGQYSPEVVDCPPPAPFPGPRGSCALYLQQSGGVVDDRLNYRAALGPSYFDLDVAEAAWNNEFRLGDHTLTALTTYFDQNAHTYISAQAVPVAGVGNSSSRSPFLTIEQYESYSQELRLQSPTGNFLEYMAGLYYLHGDLRITAYAGSYGSTAGAAGAPVTNANTPIVGVRNLHQREDSYSAFGSLTANFTDRLKLNLGLRYTSVHKKADRSVQAGAGGFTPGPDYTRLPANVEARILQQIAFVDGPFAAPSTTYSKLMPSASLQYNITRDITAYASYTKGFLAGGYTDTQTPQQFGAENVNAYEIGIKGSLFDRALTFNLDAFQSDYDDLQESFSFVSTIPPFNSVTEIRNVAKARSRGVEFSGTYRPADWLSFTTELNYIDSKYLSYPGAACTGPQTITRGASCTQDLSGRPRILAPKFVGSLSANLTVPAGDGFSIGVNPQIYHSSSYYLNAALDPQLRQMGYEKLDLRVDFGPEDRHWEIAVLGKNLTNAISSTVGTLLGSSAGSVLVLPERARSIAISFTVKN